jgi:hypothetical protein
VSDLHTVAHALAQVLRGQIPAGLGDETFPEAPMMLVFDTRNRPSDRGTLPAFTGSIGGDIVKRICCALGGDSSPSLDVARLGDEPHQYRPKTPTALLRGGGLTGYVYTRRGGFIDLGHVRDYIDYTRWFSTYFSDRGTQELVVNASSFLFSESGDIHLVKKPLPQRPAPVTAALVGARLAYDRALWHEIVSYFNKEKFSSFAPEDNFSNAVGVLAGFEAVLTQIEFNEAADRALLKVLDALGYVGKETTEAATDFVEDHWWKPEGFLGGFMPPAKRRNFAAFSPVTPWLVTDIKVDGKTAADEPLLAALARPIAASIVMPTQIEGVALDGLAELVIANVHPTASEPDAKEVGAQLQKLLPSLDAFKPGPTQGQIRTKDFPAIVEAIRTEEVSQHTNADLP